ncbi:MAG: lytic transglycosylase domain-containing protein [Deltaproteobacteria bacterium]|nr:lytic transglycosylase domain-containing protein [Deltaproteobacteria bacterium]
MASRRVLVAAVVAGLLAAAAAPAEILVLKNGGGDLLITNRGERSGYKVISRHREFFGSSGMGLGGALGGDPAKYEQTVRRLALQYSLEASLVKAVIRAESNFDPMAISPKGAMGLMQLMPDTARMHEVRNAFDPSENIHGGIRHLRYLMDRYGGNLDLVLAAYNAGTKPVDLARGIPRIPETQEYVRRVRLFHAVYRNDRATVAAGAPLIARAGLAAQTIAQAYRVSVVARERAD